MDFLTKPLAKRFLGAYQEPLTVEARVKGGVFEGTVSIIGNILLTALKLIFALVTNSIALLADAVHTASDVLTSAVVVAGFRMAKRPADIDHPYGHGRIEPIATLIISVLLFWAGIEFAHAAYDRLRQPPDIKWNAVAFGLMVFSAVFKEWMTRFALSIGKLIESDMLKADAWHHRSDAAASVLVAISLVAAPWGYKRIDSVFGFCVAGLIVYTGIHLLRSMTNILMGMAPSQDLIDRVIKAGLSVDGVEEVHDINVHDYGHQKVISLHVVIPGELDTTRSHHLATLVERAVADAVKASTVVHVDPSLPSQLVPTRQTVENTVKQVIRAYPEIKGFKGIRVSAPKGRPVVDFHIIMDGRQSLEEAHATGCRVVEDLKKCLAGCEVNVQLEPTDTLSPQGS
jgi:cation diffusion facilitator family transporter